MKNQVSNEKAKAIYMMTKLQGISMVLEQGVVLKAVIEQGPIVIEQGPAGRSFKSISYILSNL